MRWSLRQNFHALPLPPLYSQGVVEDLRENLGCQTFQNLGPEFKILRNICILLQRKFHEQTIIFSYFRSEYYKRIIFAIHYKVENDGRTHEGFR